MGREQYPETTILRQVNGVGAITALSFVLTLDDPTRFKNSRSVGAFLGLRPKHDQSGERNPELRITKAGNRDLRRLLVQCAHYMIGPFGTTVTLERILTCVVLGRPWQHVVARSQSDVRWLLSPESYRCFYIACG
jgi:transposase